MKKLPAAALAMHIIVLGKTRSGKSSKLRVIVESLLDREQPVCIIDPKGDWWGLKSSADGRSAGYPVVIFGGEHADVPINRHSGAAVAELVATGNRPCIIDLGGWMVAERTDFFIAFASTLFKTTRGSRHLVIDEVHNFCPKGKIMDPNAGKMLHWANRLASEGAGKGLTLIAASQRPQKVHNDFLTSCETLIACKVIHKADRDAIKDWIDGCADPGIGKEVLAGLAQMTKPQAWVWSPEAGVGPELMEFPLFSTYDSFRPQAADATRLKGWAEVNLEEVKAKLAAAVAEAEANDPIALKREIAGLKRIVVELERCKKISIPSETMEQEFAAAERRGYERAVIAANNQLADTVHGLRGRLTSAISGVVDAAIGAVFADIPKPKIQPPPVPVVRGQTAKAKWPGVLAPTLRKAFEKQGSEQAGLNRIDQRILDAIAWLVDKGVDPITRAAAAARAGTKVTGGYFSNALGRLRTGNLVEYPTGGTVTLTAEGAAIATVRNEGSLSDSWLGIVNGIDHRILKCLIELHPTESEIGKVYLAEAIGTEASGGYFSNALGRLRTLGAIDYPRPGVVALTRNVMP